VQKQKGRVQGIIAARCAEKVVPRQFSRQDGVLGQQAALDEGVARAFHNRNAAGRGDLFGDDGRGLEVIHYRRPRRLAKQMPYQEHQRTVRRLNTPPPVHQNDPVAVPVIGHAQLRTGGQYPFPQARQVGGLGRVRVAVREGAVGRTVQAFHALAALFQQPRNQVPVGAVPRIHHDVARSVQRERLQQGSLIVLGKVGASVTPQSISELAAFHG